MPPVYSPSEKQALISKGGTKSDKGWIFLNDRIALPWEQAPKIITEIHQSLHIGPKVLHRFVQPLFFSPGLQQTTDQVHKACITCSKVSPQGGLRFPTHQTHGNLLAQDWQIDFTHMHTHKKLHYLLSFSAWIEAFPTSRETADMVASLLVQEIIPSFGLPATIRSDNGPAFTAQVVQLVAKSLSISWKLHILYHPQLPGPENPHPVTPLQPGNSVLLRELKPGSLQPRNPELRAPPPGPIILHRQTAKQAAVSLLSPSSSKAAVRLPSPSSSHTVFTGPHKENFQGGCKPDAASPLCPTPSRSTSQLTAPHTLPLLSRK
nr:uncharacterized protein LOC120367937 isoform X2 [Saimiri boliviensis boliviensis]